MRFLPIFLDPRHGHVVLVGAGAPAEARLRLLAASGARVRWYVTASRDEPAQASSIVPNAEVGIAIGDPLAASLDGVVAVLCAGAGDVGAEMAGRAQARGIPVNVMDDPAHSTFILPAIVDRGDVVVAVGTGGSSAVVARRVRESIEALLPARLGDLAALVGAFRKTITARIPDMPLRRRFWETVVDGALGRLVLDGRRQEAEAALHAMADPATFADAPRSGFVTLVGAGPGDPDLLTVKALRALQDADVIFHDELVSPEVLDRARRDAERVPVGRRIGRPGIGQDNIHRLLIAAAQDGKRAVRLKGGDPFVFGRGGEEIEALREAGVPYAVVPGITAGVGAAAQSEVPLTFRHEALRITFLTAHRAKDAEAMDWSTLTDARMTVVVYMGVAAAAAIRAGLFKAGRAPQTPVGVFARATRPDAMSVVGVLDDLPALVARVDNGPAVLVIGDVVTHSLPWLAANLPTIASSARVAAP